MSQFDGLQSMDQMTKLGDYEIAELRLFADAGGDIDLKEGGQFMRLSIFEDIFSPTMHGFIYIRDGQGILNRMPINAHETLLASFRTPGIGGDYVDFLLETSKVDERVRSLGERAEGYKLDLNTTGARKNLQSRVSTALSGSPESIIEVICTDYLDGTLTAEKSSNDISKFAFPNMRPLRAIRSIVPLALNSKGESDFLFYEDRGGYNFKSLSTIINRKKKKPKATYTLKPAASRESDDANRNQSFLEGFTNLRDYSPMRQSDHVQSMESGQFSTQVYSYDIWGKSVISSMSNYYPEFSQYDREAKHPVIPTNSRYISGKNRIIVEPKTAKSNTDSDTQRYQSEPDKYRGSRVVLLNQITSQQVKIMVPGNSLLELGDHVEILIPRADPIDKSEPVWFDERASGVYTITAIRHDIDSNEYTNTLELSRSGTPLEYPSEGKFLGRSKEPDNAAQGVFLG